MVYAGIILERNGKFLMQLRDNKRWIKYPGMWGIWGGSIKPGEGKKIAAIREVKEETGLELSKKELVFINKIKTRKIFCFVYYCKFRWDINKINLREGQDFKFFSYEELKNLDNLTPDIKKSR